jgi:HEAT repeat protein
MAVVVFLLATAANGDLAGAAERKPSKPPRLATRGLSETDAVLRVLRAAVEDSDYATRLMAIEALGFVRWIDVTPWLARALGDPEHDVRVAAVEALRRLGSVAAHRLLRSVVDDDQEQLDVRALAASALVSPTRTNTEAP